MKIFLAAFATLALSMGAAFAQTTTPIHPVTTSAGSAHDETGFSARNDSAVSPESTKAQPNPHPVLTPRAGGVFVDGAKYGWVMISPAAPAEYGIGAKYLAAPNSRYDLERECGPAAHHDAGGIKLLTFEF